MTSTGSSSNCSFVFCSPSKQPYRLQISHMLPLDRARWAVSPLFAVFFMLTQLTRCCLCIYILFSTDRSVFSHQLARKLYIYCTKRLTVPLSTFTPVSSMTFEVFIVSTTHKPLEQISFFIKVYRSLLLFGLEGLYRESQ